MNIKTINNNIILNIKGQKAVLDIAEIPKVSVSTKAIFKELGTDASNYLVYPLKTKAEVLTHTIQKLQYSKEHETKDKIFAVLRSALTVAIVVGGVLGSIAMAWCIPAAIGIGLATFIGYTILCYYNANRIGLDLSGADKAGPFIAWIGGPCFPLYEGFGKISRLENEIAIQKQAIETNFLELVSFFKHDRSELQKLLEKEIEKSDLSLKMLSQLPSTTQAGKQEIEERLEKHVRALKELKKAEAYYPQFQR